LALLKARVNLASLSDHSLPSVTFGGGSAGFAVGLFQSGDLKLAHLEHGLHHSLRFFPILVVQQFT
jgi:hypothetical protein